MKASDNTQAALRRLQIVTRVEFGLTYPVPILDSVLP